jgi:hypothetical protein
MLALSVMLGNWLAIATPTSAEAEWRLASAARTSGRCSTMLRRQVEGQLLRQPETVEAEALDRATSVVRPVSVARRFALLRQRLLQGRQGRLDLGQCGLLRGDVGAGDGAQPRLAVQDVERVALGGDDALGPVDLGAQRGLEDRRGDDVGREREIGALELEALRFSERLERFDLAAVGAPQIEVVGERQPKGEQRVAVIVVRRRRRQEGRHLVGGRAEIALHKREQRGALGAGVLARNLEGGGGGMDVGVGAQRLLDQAVQLRRLEHPPPLAGDIEALDDALRLAAVDATRHEVERPIRQIGLRPGRLGCLEIGPERAAREQAGECRDRRSPHGVSGTAAGTPCGARR